MKKGGKNGGKQTNSIFFLENRQSEYFCLTYFSKLNRDQIEKKLWHFEDNPVSGRGEKPSRKSRKSDTTFRWVLMCCPKDKKTFFFALNAGKMKHKERKKKKRKRLKKQKNNIAKKNEF